MKRDDQRVIERRVDVGVLSAFVPDGSFDETYVVVHHHARRVQAQQARIFATLFGGNRVGGVQKLPVVNFEREGRQWLAGITVSDDVVGVQPSQPLFDRCADLGDARLPGSLLVDVEFEDEVGVAGFVGAVEYRCFVGAPGPL